MAKIYLQPGQAFTLCTVTCGFRIGASGTSVDSRVETWNNDKGEGVGSLEATGIRDLGPEGPQNPRGRYQFSVFHEAETGRFWYDDTWGL